MLEKTLNNKLPSIEDALTSTIIGLLKYLPSETFWYIIKQACCDSSNLPMNANELIECSFWPRWNAKGTTNSRFVEPDVFLRFAEFDVIVEAKLSDDGGQYQEQWSNQIIAYLNEYSDQEVYEDKPRELFYITLGGNTTKNNDSTKIEYGNKTIKYVVNKCNWMGLLIETLNTQKKLKSMVVPIPNKNSIIRILEDTIRGFNFFGYYKISWFEHMNVLTIDNSTFNGLEL